MRESDLDNTRRSNDIKGSRGMGQEEGDMESREELVIS